MKNCFFEDFDLNMTVRLISFMKKDKHGYYVEVQIPKQYIVTLIENDITPTHIGSGEFKIKIRINNNTHIRIDNVLLRDLSKIDFDKIPISKIIIRELILERYSQKSMQHYSDCDCYATRFILNITSHHRNLLYNGRQAYVYG